MQIKNTYFSISKTYTTLNALSTIEIFIQMLKSADADKAPQHTIYKRIAARKRHNNQPNFVLQKRVKLAIKKLKKSKKNFRLTTFSPKKGALFVVVRLVFEDRKSAIELFGENGTNNLVREGHPRE